MIRTVLKWQFCATFASTLLSTAWLGVHGLLSALLGGALNMAAVALAGMLLGKRRGRTPREAMLALLRSELSKLLLIIAGLGGVLAYYTRLEAAAFFTTFALTVMPFIVPLASSSDKKTN